METALGAVALCFLRSHQPIKQLLVDAEHFGSQRPRPDIISQKPDVETRTSRLYILDPSLRARHESEDTKPLKLGIIGADIAEREARLRQILLHIPEEGPVVIVAISHVALLARFSELLYFAHQKPRSRPHQLDH